MPRDNVETVRLVYRAWSEGDIEALLAVTDSAAELLTSGTFPDLAPVYRGHDGIRSFWQSMRDPWESFQLDPERVVEEDDRVAVAVCFRARGRGSGVGSELRQGHAYWLRDGQVVKVSTHTSFAEALTAAGLQEP